MKGFDGKYTEATKVDYRTLFHILHSGLYKQNHLIFFTFPSVEATPEIPMARPVAWDLTHQAM